MPRKKVYKNFNADDIGRHARLNKDHLRLVAYNYLKKEVQYYYDEDNFMDTYYLNDAGDDAIYVPHHEREHRWLGDSIYDPAIHNSKEDYKIWSDKATKEYLEGSDESDSQGYDELQEDLDVMNPNLGLVEDEDEEAEPLDFAMLAQSLGQKYGDEDD
tara:strand:+ start:55 stop:528 length:474 start_codon:yes stop_codon:yes gene_type:complete